MRIKFFKNNVFQKVFLLIVFFAVIIISNKSVISNWLSNPNFNTELILNYFYILFSAISLLFLKDLFMKKVLKRKVKSVNWMNELGFDKFFYQRWKTKVIYSAIFVLLMYIFTLMKRWFENF